MQAVGTPPGKSEYRSILSKFRYLRQQVCGNGKKKRKLVI